MEQNRKADHGDSPSSDAQAEKSTDNVPQGLIQNRTEAATEGLESDSDVPNGQVPPGAPVFMGKPVMEQRTFDTGEPAVIMQVRFEAQYEPVIMWMDPQGRLVEQSERFTFNFIQEQDNQYLAWLELKSYQPMDAGTYICNIRNEAGHADAELTVNILEEEPPTSPLVPGMSQRQQAGRKYTNATFDVEPTKRLSPIAEVTEETSLLSQSSGGPDLPEEPMDTSPGPQLQPGFSPVPRVAPAAGSATERAAATSTPSTPAAPPTSAQGPQTTTAAVASGTQVVPVVPAAAAPPRPPAAAPLVPAAAAQPQFLQHRHDSKKRLELPRVLTTRQMQNTVAQRNRRRRKRRSSAVEERCRSRSPLRPEQVNFVAQHSEEPFCKRPGSSTKTTIVSPNSDDNPQSGSYGNIADEPFGHAKSCLGMDGSSQQGQGTSPSDFDRDYIPTKKYMNNNYERKALIINNYEFIRGQEKEYRWGSDLDENDLVDLFQSLEFDPIVYRDLTSQEITEVLADFMAHPAHEFADSMAVAIMSHGSYRNILGVNWRPVEIDCIRDIICGRQEMNGKPKILIVQSCRGGIADKGSPCPTIDSPVSSMEHQRQCIVLPTESDLLIAWATSDGHIAIRDNFNGSSFIQSICHVFHRCAHKDDVVTMLTKVNFRVSTLYGTNEDDLQQQPQIEVGLRKHFYLFGDENEEKGQ